MKSLFQLIFILGFAYLMVASMIWRVKNPLANNHTTTFVNNFSSVVSLGEIPQFQFVAVNKN